MADNTIKIGGELESMATGKIVAAASAIKDKSRNKTQEVINGDVEAAIAEQSAQFEALSEETSEAVTSAAKSARQAKQYLADLQEAITELPDGQAVSAQVAVNQVTIDGIINKGYKFGGFVTPSSSPISGAEKYFYIATQNGTYVNFGGVVLNDETAILYSTDSQHSTTAKCGQAICGYAICGTN